MSRETLHSNRNWIVWRNEDGRKKPYRPQDGKPASSTNPDDWVSHVEAQEAVANSLETTRPYTGLGFVFSADDSFVGIDLDDCRDPATGAIEHWAQEIIDAAGTYAEVSPSKTGVKLYGLGEVPGGKGRQVEYGGGKVEAYDRGRYFAFTGELLGDCQEVKEVQPFLDEWHPRLFGQTTRDRPEGSTAELDVADKGRGAIDHCHTLLSACEDSVEGHRGSDKLIHALCEIRRMKLNEKQSWELIHWFNRNKCFPEWDQGELERKWNDAKGMQPIVIATEVFGPCVTAPARPRLELLPSNVICTMDFQQDFILDNLVVKGQPLVIAGMSKTLKTGIGLDLALSAASGTPAFSYEDFQPTRQTRVAFFTGESGGGAVQRRLHNLCENRGLDRHEAVGDRLLVCLKAPKLHRADDVLFIKEAIEEHEIGLCLIDPAYLSVLGAADADKATSVNAMGEILEGFNELGASYGCTMGMVHHFTKSSILRKKDWPRLEQMSGSGYAEWARQWVLLGRVKPMERGEHQLKMHVGGSEGHGDNFYLDIDEGYEDFKRGSKWEVEVRRSNPSAEEEFARLDQKAKKEQKKEQEDADRDRKVLAAVRRLSEAGEEVTENRLRSGEHLGRPENIKASLGRLVDESLLASFAGKRAGQPCQLYVAL